MTLQCSHCGSAATLDRQDVLGDWAICPACFRYFPWREAQPSDPVNAIGKPVDPMPPGVTGAEMEGRIMQATNGGEGKRVATGRAELRDGERELLAVQLRQARQLEELGRLVGGIAHDFNNVLSVVLAYCDIGPADAARGGVTEQRLADIRAAAARGARLVQRLMGVWRPAEVKLRTPDLRRAVSGRLVLTS